MAAIAVAISEWHRGSDTALGILVCSPFFWVLQGLAIAAAFNASRFGRRSRGQGSRVRRGQKESVVFREPPKEEIR